MHKWRALDASVVWEGSPNMGRYSDVVSNEKQVNQQVSENHSALNIQDPCKFLLAVPRMKDLTILYLANIQDVLGFYCFLFFYSKQL